MADNQNCFTKKCQKVDFTSIFTANQSNIQNRQTQGNIFKTANPINIQNQVKQPLNIPSIKTSQTFTSNKQQTVVPLERTSTSQNQNTLYSRQPIQLIHKHDSPQVVKKLQPIDVVEQENQLQKKTHVKQTNFRADPINEPNGNHNQLKVQKNIKVSITFTGPTEIQIKRTLNGKGQTISKKQKNAQPFYQTVKKYLINKSQSIKILRKYDVLTSNTSLFEQNIQSIFPRSIANRHLLGFDFYTKSSSSITQRQNRQFYQYFIQNKPYSKAIDLIMKTYNNINCVCAFYILNCVTYENKSKYPIKNMVQIGKLNPQILKRQIFLENSIQTEFYLSENIKYEYLSFVLKDKLSLLKIYENNMLEKGSFVPQRNQNSVRNHLPNNQIYTFLPSNPLHFYFQTFFRIQQYNTYQLSHQHSNHQIQIIQILNQTLIKIVNLVDIYYTNSDQIQRMDNKSIANEVFSECIRFLDNIGKRFDYHGYFINIEELKNKLLSIKIKQALDKYVSGLGLKNQQNKINQSKKMDLKPHHLDFKQYGSWKYLLTYLFNDIQQSQYQQDSSKTIQLLYNVLEKMINITQIQACQQWIRLFEAKIQKFIKRLKIVNKANTSIKIEVVEFVVLTKCLERLTFMSNKNRNNQSKKKDFAQMPFQELRNQSNVQEKVEIQVNQLFNKLYKCMIQTRRMCVPRFLLTTWLSFSSGSSQVNNKKSNQKNSIENKKVNLKLQMTNLLLMLNLFVQQKPQNRDYFKKMESDQAKIIFPNNILNIQFDKFYILCIKNNLAKINQNQKTYQINFTLRDLILKSIQVVFERLNVSEQINLQQRFKNLKSVIQQLIKQKKNDLSLLKQLGKNYLKKEFVEVKEGEQLKLQQLQSQQESFLQSKVSLFKQFNDKFLSKLIKIMLIMNTQDVQKIQQQIKSERKGQKNIQYHCSEIVNLSKIQEAIKSLLHKIHQNFSLFSSSSISFMKQVEIELIQQNNNNQKYIFYQKVMNYQLQLFQSLLRNYNDNLCRIFNDQLTNRSNLEFISKFILDYMDYLSVFFSSNWNATKMNFLQVDIKIILLNRLLEKCYKIQKENQIEYVQENKINKLVISFDLLVKLFKEFMLPRISQYTIISLSKPTISHTQKMNHISQSNSQKQQQDNSQTLLDYRQQMLNSYINLFNIIDLKIVKRYKILNSLKYFLSPNANVQNIQNFSAVKNKVNNLLVLLVQYERKRGISQDMLSKNTQTLQNIKALQIKQNTLPAFPSEIINSIIVVLFAQNFPKKLLSHITHQLLHNPKNPQYQSRLQSLSIFCYYLPQFQFQKLSLKAKDFYNSICSFRFLIVQKLIKYYNDENSTIQNRNQHLNIQALEFIKLLSNDDFIHFFQKVLIDDFSLKNVVIKSIKLNEHKQQLMRQKQSLFQSSTLKCRYQDHEFNLVQDRKICQYMYFMHLRQHVLSSVKKLESKVGKQINPQPNKPNKSNNISGKQQSSNIVIDQTFDDIIELGQLLNNMNQYHWLTKKLLKILEEVLLKTQKQRQQFYQQYHQLNLTFVNCYLKMLPETYDTVKLQEKKIYRNMVIRILHLIQEQKDNFIGKIKLSQKGMMWRILSDIKIEDFDMKIFTGEWSQLNCKYYWHLGVYVHEQFVPRVYDMTLSLMLLYSHEQNHRIKQYAIQNYKKNQPDKLAKLSIQNFTYLRDFYSLNSLIIEYFINFSQEHDLTKKSNRSLKSALITIFHNMVLITDYMHFDIMKYLSLFSINKKKVQSCSPKQIQFFQINQVVFQQIITFKQQLERFTGMYPQIRGFQDLNIFMKQTTNKADQRLFQMEELPLAKIARRQKQLQQMPQYFSVDNLILMNQSAKQKLNGQNNKITNRNQLKIPVQFSKLYQQQIYSSIIYYGKIIPEKLKCVRFSDFQIKLREFMKGLFFMPVFKVQLQQNYQTNIRNGCQQPLQIVNYNQTLAFLQSFTKFLKTNQQFSIYYDDIFMIQKQLNYNTIKRQFKNMFKNIQLYKQFIEYYPSILQQDNQIYSKVLDIVKIANMKYIAVLMQLFMTLFKGFVADDKCSEQKERQTKNNQNDSEYKKILQRININKKQHMKFFMHSIIMRIVVCSEVVDDVLNMKFQEPLFDFKLQNNNQLSHSQSFSNSIHARNGNSYIHKTLIRPLEVKIFLVNLYQFLNVILNKRILLAADIQLPLSKLCYADYIFDTRTQAYHKLSLLDVLCSNLWVKTAQFLQKQNIKQVYRSGMLTEPYSHPFLDKQIDFKGYQKQISHKYVQIKSTKNLHYYNRNSIKSTNQITKIHYHQKAQIIDYNYIEYFEQILNIEMFYKFIKHINLVDLKTISLPGGIKQELFIRGLLSAQAFSHLGLFYDTYFNDKLKNKQQRQRQKISNTQKQEEFTKMVQKFRVFQYTGFRNLQVSLHALIFTNNGHYNSKINFSGSMSEKSQINPFQMIKKIVEGLVGQVNKRQIDQTFLMAFHNNKQQMKVFNDIMGYFAFNGKYEKSLPIFSAVLNNM